ASCAVMLVFGAWVVERGVMAALHADEPQKFVYAPCNSVLPLDLVPVVGGPLGRSSCAHGIPLAATAVQTRHEAGTESQIESRVDLIARLPKDRTRKALGASADK